MAIVLKKIRQLLEASAIIKRWTFINEQLKIYVLFIQLINKYLFIKHKDEETLNNKC